MSTPAIRDPWQPTRRELAVALAVVAMLAALAAFALWGMRPAATTAPSARDRAPTVTVTAAPREREDEGEGE